MEGLDVILDPLNKLSLILFDGASDVRPDEEGVEPGKDAKHLIGVLRRSQLVAEASRDASLHTGQKKLWVIASHSLESTTSVEFKCNKVW